MGMAAQIKSLASDCGSSLESLRSSGMGSFAGALQNNRDRPVDEFMSGVVNASENTPEAVIRSFLSCRGIRKKTIERWSKYFKTEVVHE